MGIPMCFFSIKKTTFNLLLALLVLSCASSKNHVKFRHALELQSTPDKIFFEANQQNKVFNDLVILLTKILDVKFNITSDGSTTNFDFHIKDTRCTITLESNADTLEVVSQCDGNKNLERAINYFLQTGVFERNFLE